MDYNKIAVAALNLDIDYERMAEEVAFAKHSTKCSTYDLPEVGDPPEILDAHSLLLRKSSETTEYGALAIKATNYESWEWDYSLDIPYTRSVIDAMPFKVLGPVTIVYFPEAGVIPHVDWDDPADTKHSLAITLLPDPAGVSCDVWIEELQKFVSIPGHAMLLNDGVIHKVAKPKGIRITMRLFGEMDYSYFKDNIDINQCYFYS